MKVMKPQTKTALMLAYVNFSNLVKRKERKWKTKDLQHAELGVGTATDFKQVVKDGYMTYANKPRPFHVQKWKLTDKGVKVLMEWHEEELKNSSINVSK